MAHPLADLAHDVPVLGPIGVGVGTLGTVWVQVLAADAQRRGVIFHNPGANDLFVAPSNLASQPANNAGAFRIYSQEEQTFFADDEHVNVNTAWYGWVSTGTNQPVSILDFTGTNNSVPAPEPLASLNQGSSISSPLGSGATLSTSASSVIGANPVRRGIAFHNPGDAEIAVFPSNLSVTYGAAGSIIISPGQTKTFLARPKSRIRVNCGWKAVAQTGSTNPLTIAEFLG
jgi:hypothetical protein